MPRQNACVLTWLSRRAVRLKSAIAVIFCIRESRGLCHSRESGNLLFDIEKKQRLCGALFLFLYLRKKPPGGGFEACLLWVFVFTKNIYCSIGTEGISSELVSLTGLSTVVLNIAYDSIAVFSLRFAVRRSNVFVMFPVESIVKR